jgi:CYTH domain-containing protein
MLEIERKYLVNSDEYKVLADKKYRIMQAYLVADDIRTIRIRMKAGKACITIKSRTDDTGISRHEWEYDIPVSDLRDMLSLCEPGIIEKTRYEVAYKGHVIEVDEFHGENAGLVVAEIELRSENEKIALPRWLGQEVTGMKQYYNSCLRKKPYNTW